VVAPNSGNQSILVKYGTDEQKRQWLLPLIEGTMESGFSMTEPHNPGSDPRSLDTTAVIDGDEFVINGHKWFTSNGIDAEFFIVMCRVVDAGSTDHKTGPMVQIIVPTATKGVDIVRGIGVWGRQESDHCEVKYHDVRVPVKNALGQIGEGHQAAQDRLGAGRIYHCMNSVGQMWRAFDLMVERAATREVRGGMLKDKQFVQGFIADGCSRSTLPRSLIKAWRRRAPMSRRSRSSCRPRTRALSTGRFRCGARRACRTTCRWRRCIKGRARCASPTDPTRSTRS
jgi:acyl-CoA dehydrogenase